MMMTTNKQGSHSAHINGSSVNLSMHILRLQLYLLPSYLPCLRGGWISK